MPGLKVQQQYEAQTIVDFGSTQYRYAPQLVTDGIVAATLETDLALNTVVRQYDVVLQAARAEATAVQNVAQVRATPASALDIQGKGIAIVLDFGTPRTVAAVSVPAPLQMVRVTPWMGTAFAPKSIYAATLSSFSSGPNQGKLKVAPEGNSDIHTAVFSSEIRTDRLLVEAVGDMEADQLAAGMNVVLPEPPTDLDVRIDGGAPVALFPGPAQAGTDAALTETAWNSANKRRVRLAEPLGKLTGNPTGSGSRKFKIVLASRVPGNLDITEEFKKLSFIRRVSFGSGASTDLVFTAEGFLEIPLGPAAPGPIEEIRLTLLATLPPERTVPPLGPDDAGLADLVVTPDRAAIVRLSATPKLADLSGIRLPLAAGADGGEARVVLWTNQGAAPLEALSDGVSEPVKLDASAAETWLTFPFKRPVTIDSANAPWAALLVSRGEVVWAMGGNAGALNANVVLRGPANGPWLPLPAPFVTLGSSMAALRGRVRMTGHAPKELPLAPLQVSLNTRAPVEVTPTPKGVPVTLTFSPAASVAGPVLRVVSKVPGTITVRDIDVISTV